MNGSSDLNVVRDNTSTSSALDTIGVEAVGANYLSKYDIPERYNINTLVLLPINPSNHFMYWEISRDYIAEKYSSEFDGFVVKFFEKRGDSFSEGLSFKVYDENGRYYINKHIPKSEVYAVLGIIDKDGRFIELLSSNIIKTPSDSTSIGDEVWMDKDSEWSELIKASLTPESDSMNSAEFIKEFETIRKHRKLKEQMDITTLTKLPSSDSFLGGSENISSFGYSSSLNVKNNMNKGEH
ncbi:MAG: DUF4912 domain-containing protein [Campylobacterales bacterium]